MGQGSMCVSWPPRHQGHGNANGCICDDCSVKCLHYDVFVLGLCTSGMDYNIYKHVVL